MYYFIFLPSATKLRQGNIFTSVCQEFCPEGCLPHLSVCWDTHPPGQTPPSNGQTPLHLSRHPPPLGRHPLPWADTPLPWADTPPPRADTPPPQQTATAADGTYPTGMLSFLFHFLFVDIPF